MRHLHLIRATINKLRIRLDLINLRQRNKLITQMQVVEAQGGVDRLISEELLAQELGRRDVELFAVVEGGELGVQQGGGRGLGDVQEGGLVVDDDHLVVVMVGLLV